MATQYVVKNTGPNRAERRANLSQMRRNTVRSAVSKHMDSPSKSEACARGSSFIESFLARNIHA